VANFENVLSLRLVAAGQQGRQGQHHDDPDVGPYHRLLMGSEAMNFAARWGAMPWSKSASSGLSRAHDNFGQPRILRCTPPGWRNAAHFLQGV